MNPLASHDDARLIGLSRAGDDAAFRELVRRHQTAVHACTLAITRTDADAQDAAQEAFIRLHRHLDQVDPSRPLRPYLLRIAANCACGLLAQGRRRASAHVPEGLADAAPSPAAGVVSRERRHAVRARVEALPPTLRQVCTLFYLGGCSCRDVAAALAMSENAVKVALHRAREHLRADLQTWRNSHEPEL